MTTKSQKVAEQLQAAAKSADRHTKPGTELAAHHLTKANAIKRGAPVPVMTVKALKEA